jgi:hypothetical protein
MDLSKTELATATFPLAYSSKAEPFYKTIKAFREKLKKTSLAW